MNASEEVFVGQGVSVISVEVFSESVSVGNGEGSSAERFVL